MLNKKQAEMVRKYRPTLRGEQELDLHSAIRGAVSRAISNEITYPFRTCINCDNFDEETEQCKKVNSRPPARIIAFGCEMYDDKDQIPF